MEELLQFSSKFSQYDFPIILFLLKSFLVLFIIIAIVLFIYDKIYPKRKSTYLLTIL